MTHNHSLRKTPRISYFEPEEPFSDDYIYCDKCTDFVYEYCSIHGPLLVIPDDKIYKENKPSHIISGSDANRANWMRYVNCSRHFLEQNLVAYQYQGNIYYRTIKIIPKFTELLIFYGSECASALQIDLRKYNQEKYYQEVIGAHTSILANGFDTVKAQKPEVKITTLGITPVDVQKVTDENHIIDNFEYIDDLPNDSSEDSFQQINQNMDQPQIDYVAENQNIVIQFNNNINDFGCDLDGVVKSDGDQYYKSINQSQTNVEGTDGYFSNSVNAQPKHVGIKKYNCLECNFKTVQQCKYDNHVSSVHTGKFKYSCEFCSRSSNSRRYLRNHYQRMHDIYPVWGVPKCDICGYISPNKLIVARHRNLHWKENVLKCELCGYLTCKEYDMKKHMSTVHAPNKTSFSCSFCSFATTTRYALENHKKNEHDIMKGMLSTTTSMH